MSDDAGVERFLDELYPYRRETKTYRDIPEHGRPASDVLAEVHGFADREDRMGDDGRVSGSLYCGDHDHYHVLSEVFEQFAHVNVLQRDMYPSATKFEAEIVSMVAGMLHAADADSDVCGVVTSGGSESLITALYAYREQARAERGIVQPNVVIPITAHVALDKGAHWLGVEVRHAPLTDAFVVDVAAMAALIDDNTIAIVGSAGNYAHGLIDPIEQLSELAVSRGIGLHVDGCLGGFLLPWIEAIGVDVPLWDFRVPGVTSISADTHKYGYALKGTSALIYRSRALRNHQWFTYPDWPGGLYLSPGFAGSRSGGLIASTWASLVITGREGYLAKAREIYDTAQAMVHGIRDGIPELRIVGEPTFLFAFVSDEVDVYLVNDELKRRGWRMNALQLPPALHFCVTRPNTAPGVAAAFLDDLRASVDYAKDNAGTPAESGAMYGLGGTPQGNESINALMGAYLDAMHDTAPQA
jgi:sphinganine-1-phosphate aldolase